jgi:hypothetical protein
MATGWPTILLTPEERQAIGDGLTLLRRLVESSKTRRAPESVADET